MSDDVARAPKRARAKQAAAETQDTGPRTIDFRGLALTLPDTPSAALLLDLGELEDGDPGLGVIRRILIGLIGEQQLRQVRDKIVADEVPLADGETVLMDLLSAAMNAYGSSLGEASASPDSS